MTLPARCAAFGWRLRPHGQGWELLGNGSPALFTCTDTLEEWLERQERARKPAKVTQLSFLDLT